MTESICIEKSIAIYIIDAVGRGGGLYSHSNWRKKEAGSIPTIKLKKLNCVM
ncbi:MAG: hypothetical protein JJU48_06750 [Methylophaga sp.]|nr:hypothetical protein [Methylophaga sp.]